MSRTYTCIVCPEGCKISVSGDEVGGYKCRRGLTYVQTEQTNPMRSLSATVRLVGGQKPLVPVKTAEQIPKSKVFAVYAFCRDLAVEAPVEAGAVLAEDVAGTGVALVATDDGI